MSYQLRISILYTGMRINNQTALSRAFAFFLIVFLPVDLFFWQTRDYLEESPRSPLPGFLLRRLSRLFNARRALCGDERSESGAQTEIKPPPLLPPDGASSFVCKRGATILTEVPARGNRSHFFACSCFFRARKNTRNISPTM